MVMIAVGVREIKSRLSAYLRMVKGGEVVLITDHGEVIAELRRPGAGAEPTPYPRLNEMIRDGTVRMGRGDAPPDLYDLPAGPRLPPGTAAALLDESRGER